MSEAPNTAVVVAETEEKKAARERQALVHQTIAFSPLGGLVPTTYEQLVTVARTLAASGYFADATDYTRVMTKIQYGAELGIPIMAALNNIDIIEGRPSLRSALIGARIRSSGFVRFKVQKWDDDGCILEWLRKYDDKWEVEGQSRWLKEDSVRAGLLKDKSNHQKFPLAMYMARAVTQGARAYCPDLFFGAVYDPEEIREEQREEKAINDAPKTGAEKLTAAIGATTDDADKPKPRRSRTGSPIVDVQPDSASVPDAKTDTAPAAVVVETKPEPTPVPPTAPTNGPTSAPPSPPTDATSTVVSEPAPSTVEQKPTEPASLPPVSPTSTQTVATEKPVDELGFDDEPTKAPEGDKLTAALVSSPSEAKAQSTHLREKREGMSEDESKILQRTLKVRAMMLIGNAAGVWALQAEDVEGARTGAKLAKAGGAAWADDMLAVLADADNKRPKT